jgi:acetyltransferase-like isoleucine patch superfamily enzyme
VTLEDGVFCGPHCVFTNDMRPRAVTADGVLKTTNEWHVTKTLVRTGASIGAHATILCGIEIGRWAMIGAGSVVTRDVPAHGLVFGTPARLQGFVCACGARLASSSGRPDPGFVAMTCSECHALVPIEEAIFAKLEIRPATSVRERS